MGFFNWLGQKASAFSSFGQKALSSFNNVGTKVLQFAQSDPVQGILSAVSSSGIPYVSQLAGGVEAGITLGSHVLDFTRHAQSLIDGIPDADAVNQQPNMTGNNSLNLAQQPMASQSAPSGQIQGMLKPSASPPMATQAPRRPLPPPPPAQTIQRTAPAAPVSSGFFGTF